MCGFSKNILFIEVIMYIKATKKSQFALDIAMIVLGSIVMGISFSFFLAPNNITTGGFSGLSLILNSLLQLIGIYFIPNAVIYFALNIGLFIYAFRALGKKFAIKAFIGIASYSIFMQVIEVIPITCTYEPLVSSLYGGILMGLGLGLVVRFGGSTGGGDLVACIVRKRKKDLSIGKIVVIIDAIVILASLFVFNNGIEVLPYTIMALILSMYLTDFVNDGYKKICAYNIITTKPKEVGETIMNKLHRGCTMTNVVGMRDMQDRYLLTCLVSKYQRDYLGRIIRSIDENAFVYAIGVQEVIGSLTSASETNMQMLELVEEEINEKRHQKQIKKETHETKQITMESNSSNTTITDNSKE